MLRTPGMWGVEAVVVVVMRDVWEEGVWEWKVGPSTSRNGQSQRG